MATVKIVKGNELEVGKMYKFSFPSKESRINCPSDNSPFLVLERNEIKPTMWQSKDLSYEVLTKDGIRTIVPWETTWLDEVPSS